MKVVILAGGFGKRMFPLTRDIPKPMVLFRSKPLLMHVIDYFRNYNLINFIICTYYLSEKIIEYFGDGSRYGIHISYIHEDKPLGTAGGVKLAEPYLQKPFIVSYGDIIRNIPLEQMINMHKLENPLISIAVYKNYSSHYKSRVSFDERNNINHFMEKRTSKSTANKYIWSNASLYICNPAIFKYVKRETKTDFASDVFPKLIQGKQKIIAFPSEGYCIDIGTLSKLKRMEKESIF